MAWRSSFRGIYSPDDDRIGPLLVCNPQEPKAERIPEKSKATLRADEGPFEWRDDLQEAHAAIIRSYTEFTRTNVRTMPNLRIIVRSGVGTNTIDNDISLEGVPFANCCPESPKGVSRRIWLYYEMDHTRIHESNAAFAAGRPGDKFPKHEGVKPLNPEDRQVVIFGHGAIGSQVLRRFESEYPGIRIAIRDPDPAVGVPMGQKRYESHDQALSEADVIIFCVPGQAGCLLGKEHMHLIKPGALVFNASRGNTIDLEALGELADTKDVHFALDVFPDEKDGFFKRADCDRIRKHPNRIALTPHTAGSDDWVEGGNATAAVARVRKFAMHGTFNEDDRRELPFGRVRPQTFPEESAGARLIIMHGCRSPREIQNAIGAASRRLLIPSHLIATASSEGRSGMPPVGYSVVDVYDENNRGSPDYGRAKAILDALGQPIDMTRSMISAYAAVYEEDQDEDERVGHS